MLKLCGIKSAIVGISMIIHERFAFECGGFVDIKRKPLAEMSSLGRQEFVLALNFIRDKLTLQYEHQLLQDKLEEVELRSKT